MPAICATMVGNLNMNMGMQNDIVFWKFFENKGFLSFDAGNPLCIMEFDARRDVSL